MELTLVAYDPATGSAELADREHVVRMRGPELAWRKEEGEFGIADLEDTMAWAMERCRQKNEDRGRYPR